MRFRKIVIKVCAVVMLVQSSTTLASHDLTCHPPPPPTIGFIFGPDDLCADVLNLILTSAGGATSTSCSDASGNIEPFGLPSDVVSAVESAFDSGQSSGYWLFLPVSQAFLEDHIGLSAELPNFTRHAAADAVPGVGTGLRV
jgi:hypothetical protein